jgi:hypothetical protein
LQELNQKKWAWSFTDMYERPVVPDMYLMIPYELPDVSENLT